MKWAAHTAEASRVGEVAEILPENQAMNEKEEAQKYNGTKSYPRSSYEGFEYLGASAVGIAVTSECRVAFTESVPAKERLEQFAFSVRKPPVCVGTPAYYHEKKAFGDWSLPRINNAEMRWYEEQLDKHYCERPTSVNDLHGVGAFLIMCAQIFLFTL